MKRSRHLCRIVAAAAIGWKEQLSAWYGTALADGVEPDALFEATLQVFLFAGYPRTIDAFAALRGVVGDVRAPLEPKAKDLPARGRKVFEQVYGDHTKPVLAFLEGLHHDFARFLIRDAYGQVLGRPFLKMVDRELMAVSMLAALELRMQLKAHVRGALRVGAKPKQVRRALEAAEDAAGPLPEARELAEGVLDEARSQ